MLVKDFTLALLPCLLRCVVSYSQSPASEGLGNKAEPQHPLHDYVVVEGDIKMTREDMAAFHLSDDLEGSGTGLWAGRTTGDQGVVTEHQGQPGHMIPSHSRRSKRAVTALQERLWPNATIPYVIGPDITGFMIQNIHQAMGHWEKHTCIKFVNRTKADQDYIYFAPGPCGCCSFVGRKGGNQEVTLSPHCAAFGVVIHELGHVIGFWHEHSRPDRDKYIEILHKNVVPEKLDNFDKKSAGEIDSLGQPYDYYSIMHYRRKTFSKSGKNTMEPRKKGVRIGQRESLSPGDIVQATLLYSCPKPKCYEELTEPSGNISTPNYPVKYYRGHQCTWIIHVQPGEEVHIEFLDFSLEYSTNCTYDYLELREGIDDTGPMIGRLCGEGMPGNIQTSNSIWLRFVSDKSVAQRGFLARYTKRMVLDYSGSGISWEMMDGSGFDVVGTPDPYYYGNKQMPTLYTASCHEDLKDRKGQISSPLIPVHYDNHPIDCSWTIDGGKDATKILLVIELPSLRDTTELCAGQIYQLVKERVRHGTSKHWHKATVDKQDNNAIKQGKDKGMGTQHEPPQDIYFDLEKYTAVRYNCQNSKQILLSTTRVMIQWSSDLHQHFNLNYIIDYDECVLRTASCDHVCHNTLQGYTCSCHRGYEPHNSHFNKCVPKLAQFSDHCGEHLRSERGRLRASTEPMEDCEWTIQPEGNLRLTFIFHKFNVPSRKFNNTCLENYIEVFTGSSRTLRGRFCGQKTPPSIATPSNLMVIRMHTNTSSVYAMPYFTATYTSMADEELTGCSKRMKASGEVTSPGYPSSYPAHSNCVWRISAPKGSSILVNFDLMDIESTKMCQFDYIEMRDGRHKTSPLLGKYCGSTVPREIYTKGRHLWMNFVSDKDGTGQGFKAKLSSIDSIPTPPSLTNSTGIRDSVKNKSSKQINKIEKQDKKKEKTSNANLNIDDKKKDINKTVKQPKNKTFVPQNMARRKSSRRSKQIT